MGQFGAPHFLLPSLFDRRSVLSAWVAYTASIRLFFFFPWNISNAIGVRSLSVPTAVLHVLLFKPGRAEQSQTDLRGTNILSTWFFHVWKHRRGILTIFRVAQWQCSTETSLLINSWYFFQSLTPRHLITLKYCSLRSQSKRLLDTQGFTSATTQHLSFHYCSRISRDKHRCMAQLKPNGVWDDSICTERSLDLKLAHAGSMTE